MSEPQQAPLKVVLCTIAFREKLLDDALDAAHKLGFEGIEVWGREPHIGERYDENRVRAAQKMIQAKELSVPVLSSYLRMGMTGPPPEDAVELTDTLHSARQLKARLVRVWMSDVASAKATEAVWTKTVAETRHACDCAAKLGLGLIAQMHDGTLADTGDASRRLVEEVERGNFGVIYRVATWDNGESPVERLQKVLPYVRHVHARNYASPLPSRSDTPPAKAPLGSGVIDYRRIVGTLREAGYDGHIAIEFAYKDGDAKKAALAEDLAFLRSL